MTKIIAGHPMTDTTVGLACQDCGRRFVDLTAVQRSDIGRLGWAHQGALNEAEYDQIRAEIERMWTHTAAIASGAGIGGMAAGEGTSCEMARE